MEGWNEWLRQKQGIDGARPAWFRTRLHDTRAHEVVKNCNALRAVGR
jgi:hypothetical protein